MRDDTFREMCSSEPMRSILAGMWKPKVGDQYWDNSNEWGGSVDAFSKQYVEGLSWLPREGELMEMLRPSVWYFQWFTTEPNYASVDFKPQEFKSFKGAFRETLLLAFGWTKGLKWEDREWRER